MLHIQHYLRKPCDANGTIDGALEQMVPSDYLDNCELNMPDTDQVDDDVSRGAVPVRYVVHSALPMKPSIDQSG